MGDQNQAGIKINGQPVMGGNPYDLIDNKNQISPPTVVPEVAQKVVQNIQVEQTVPVVQQATVNVEPVVAPQNIVEPVQSVQQPVQSVAPVVPVIQAQIPQAKPLKEPGGFVKKLIGFIAKMSGQPDPETGKGAVVAKIGEVAPVDQTNQTVINTSGVGNVPTPFDSIMGGVTGFLDKVEAKVEKVSGVNFDAVMPMQQPAQQVVQQPVQAVVPVTPVEAVKAEIEIVKNNEDVAVNPISAEIQQPQPPQQVNIK